MPWSDVVSTVERTIPAGAGIVVVAAVRVDIIAKLAAQLRCSAVPKPLTDPYRLLRL